MGRGLAVSAHSPQPTAFLIGPLSSMLVNVTRMRHECEKGAWSAKKEETRWRRPWGGGV